ncbi:SA1362 family protein [Jeotgalibacillus soli]|uniref:YqhP n=1 Tax=Jeotgalibacillus soli TaxID=889306 RepID=A0A0C2VK47_9BACL|nr:SA1362 family protein [Jeotgalibacillus soli]KIL44373.1 hypothetical protein KP78_33370 [Jeotgalibacillus soli]
MKIRTTIFFVVMVLAAFGLSFMLITEPGNVFRTLLTYAAIAGLIYFIYRMWIRRKPNRREQQAFKKAVKHSKKRYGNPVSASKMKANKAKPKAPIPFKKTSINRIDAPKLTVIEGKKGKKKKKISL